MKPGATVAGNTHDGILTWRGDNAFEGSVRLMNGRLANMTSSKATEPKPATPDTTYVVMVVGGAPIFVVEDFEHAVSVCDALAAGAKASGFAAKYDVVEVKRWSI